MDEVKGFFDVFIDFLESPVVLIIVAALVTNVTTHFTLKWSKGAQYANETLMEAYLSIEKAYSRNYSRNPMYAKMESQWQLDLEDALAKIQLLAPSEIANKVSDSIRPGEPFLPDPDLLVDIRKHVREKLALEAVSNAPRSLRHERHS